MDRRRFLVSSAGASAAALGVPWLATAAAATDDDLAFANFGVSAELLLTDFYARALATRRFTGARATALREGRAAATRHTKALSDLLAGAGDTAPLEEDFEFVWPPNAFATAPATVKTGVTLVRGLLGAYQTAAATASVPDYRILFASLGASVGQQIGALSAATEPFPVATDLETASNVLEPYLG
jgi:Ferritin-like domain